MILRDDSRGELEASLGSDGLSIVLWRGADTFTRFTFGLATE